MKYFIDCGTHHGEGLKHFVDQYNVDSTWTIHTFEPNKTSFEIVKALEYKNCNIIKHNLGIWTEDTVLTFRPETTHPVNGRQPDGAGSTFISENNWNIKSPGNWGAGDYIESYQIPVINFSRFLSELENPEFVLVKMDIEGSEYNVLRKLINDNSIRIVNDIYVEFHDWAMRTTGNDTTDGLINEISSKGIKIVKWI